MKIKFTIILSIFSFLISLTIGNKLVAQTNTKLDWINFSPYIKNGQNPNNLTYIDSSQIITLLDTLKPYTQGIRTYGTKYGLENIPHLAKLRGMNVILGIWLGNDTISNAEQLASGIKIAQNGYADKIIVGSEVLLRDTLPANKIIEYINQVKVACPNIPVSYADIVSNLINNPEIINVCDFVSVNIYPFWEGYPIECAMHEFNESYQTLLEKVGQKQIFISESGWKTFGTSVLDAIPSLENAIWYDSHLLMWSKAMNVELALFSAFDEPWKAPNDDGWGIFNSDAELKPGMDALFKPITNIDSTWLCKDLMNMSQDTLYIDYMPFINSHLNIKGHVDHINTCDYRIATYIKVDGNWWSKPTYAQPAVPILCNGNWMVDYTTEGNDIFATDICMFLIPSDFSPLLCGGSIYIPQDVYQNAVVWKCIHREELEDAQLTASADTICFGDSVTLTASGGTSYLWNTGETTSSITVSPDPYTEYSVEISTGLGVGKKLTKSIYVISNHLFIISDRYVICSGDTTNLNILKSGSSEIISLLWNNGETNDTIQVSPASTTTYTVTATTVEGCTLTASYTQLVDSSLLKLIAIPDTIIKGTSSNISLSDYAYSYLWSTGETWHNITVSPLSTTTYFLSFTDQWNCTFVAQITITVIDTLSNNNDLLSSQISVYPNPAKTNLEIKLPDNKSDEITISITNIFGQLLIREKLSRFISKSVLNYDISNFVSGIYFVILETEKEIITKKMVKE